MSIYFLLVFPPQIDFRSHLHARVFLECTSVVRRVIYVGTRLLWSPSVISLHLPPVDRPFDPPHSCSTFRLFCGNQRRPLTFTSSYQSKSPTFLEIISYFINTRRKVAALPVWQYRSDKSVWTLSWTHDNLK